jgi:chlorophyll synthase
MRLLDFFFALRPLVLVPAWSFFVLGWHASQGAVPAPFPALRFALLTLVLCGAYLVNQIVDRDSDRLNDKGFFLQRGIFAPRDYAWAAALAITAGCALAWVWDAAPLRIAAAAALGLAYSVPPIRLAARPGLDLAANALGYGVLASSIGAGAVRLPLHLFVSGALAVAAVFLHTTILDLDGDRRTGKRTSGAWLGARVAVDVAAVVAVLAAAAAGGAVRALLSPALLQAAATLALTALALFASLLPRRVSSRAVCVGGSGAFALAAAIACPPFGLAVLALVIVTRVYYRRRFALAYPAL